MTLKSALQDVKETTLAAISGMLAKLVYLASLRRAQGRYDRSKSRWPAVMFVGCALLVAGTVLLLY